MILEEKRWFKITFQGRFFGLVKEVQDETHLLDYVKEVISNLKKQLSETKLEGSLYNNLKINEINIIEDKDMYKLRII